jgi:hypothetical protein
MEKSPVVIALLTMMMVKSVNAQIKSTDSVRKEKTRSGATIGEEKFRKEDRVEVKFENLPTQLRNTLQRDEKYKNLKVDRIYLDRSNKEYLIHFNDSLATRTRRFSESGVLLDSLDQH